MSAETELDPLANFTRMQRSRTWIVTGATLATLGIALFVLVRILVRVDAATAELAGLEAQKKKVEAELADAGAQLADVQVRLSDVATDVKTKDKELARSESKVEELKGAIADSSDRRLQQQAEKIAPDGIAPVRPPPRPVSAPALPPLEAVTKVVFSNTKSEKVGTRTYYSVRFSVKVPPERVAEISRVEYHFNHDSFVPKTRTSFDRENGFALAYRGYGCITDVTVTLIGRDESKHPIKFDMCKAWRM